jgi:hypothetical protein
MPATSSRCLSEPPSGRTPASARSRAPEGRPRESGLPWRSAAGAPSPTGAGSRARRRARRPGIRSRSR